MLWPQLLVAPGVPWSVAASFRLPSTWPPLIRTAVTGFGATLTPGGLTSSSFAKTLFPKEHIPRFWAHMKWGIYQPTGAVKGEPSPSRGAGKPWLLLPSRERTSNAEKDSPDGGRSRGSWSEGPSQTRPGPSLIRTPLAEPAEVRPVTQGAVWGWGGGGSKPRLGLRSSPGLRSSLTSNTSLRGHGSDS